MSSRKLTQAEKNYIRENALSKTDAEIAEILKISEKFVARERLKFGLRKTKFLKRKVAEKKISTEQIALASKPFEMMEDAEREKYSELRLTDSPEWAIVQQGLSIDEQRQFINSWVKYFGQFKGEVTATEETQIIQLIQYEIMMARSLINKREFLKVIEKNVRMIEAERRIPEHGQDIAKIMELEARNMELRSLQINSSKEYMDLQAKHRQILTDLKGTRDQRIKEIEERNQSFFALVKYVQSRENQQREGRFMELAKKAMNKEAERFGEFHEFLDGTPDKIFLTPEGQSE